MGGDAPSEKRRAEARDRSRCLFFGSGEKRRRGRLSSSARGSRGGEVG